MFPKVAETFYRQGVEIIKLNDDPNPVYAIKFNENSLPVIGFSKEYNHPFNPTAEFGAVMTCSQADRNCLIVAGADIRILIPYEDPKISGNTTEQSDVYKLRSLEIATEMMYIFSQVHIHSCNLN